MFFFPCRPPRVRPALRKALAVCVWGACALAVLPVAARDKHDHDRARQAVQAGQVLPLPTVLDHLQREVPGQVLEVELERDDGRWIYEVKLLQAGGRLVKLELDAASGEVLQRRVRDRDRRLSP